MNQPLTKRLHDAANEIDRKAMQSALREYRKYISDTPLAYSEFRTNGTNIHLMNACYDAAAYLRNT